MFASLRVRCQLLLGCAFFSSLPLMAQETARPGDVIVLSFAGDGFGLMQTHAATVYDSNGERRFWKSIVRVGEALVAPDGNLNISRHDYLGFSTYSPAFQELSTTANGDWIFDFAMDGRETLFAIGISGRVYQFPRTGEASPPRQLPLDGNNPIVFSADLALDQCTLYFVVSTSGALRLRRYDLCRGSALPDVTLPPLPSCYRPKVRVASDGSVFFAACSAVYRVTANEVRTYAMPNGHSSNGIALTADGRSFWSAGQTLIQVDIATGMLLRAPIRLGGNIEGLAIYGVPRAAYLAGIAAIPAHSTATLLLLMVTLSAIAVSRISN